MQLCVSSWYDSKFIVNSFFLQAAAHEHVRQRKMAQRYVVEKDMQRGWPEVFLDTHATSCVPNNLYILVRSIPGVQFTASRPDISLADVGKL